MQVWCQKQKKKQVNFNTDTQKTFWNISCEDDYRYLERELTDDETRFDDALPSTILKGIIGTDWTGDITDADTDPLIMSLYSI